MTDKAPTTEPLTPERVVVKVLAPLAEKANEAEAKNPEWAKGVRFALGWIADPDFYIALDSIFGRLSEERS